MNSRIGIKLEFQDYTTDTLKSVLDKELEVYKLKLDVEASNKVLENIEQAKKNNDFGNCRYIKSLAQQIIKNYVYSNDKSKIIKKQHIPIINEVKTKQIIGFQMK